MEKVINVSVKGNLGVLFDTWKLPEGVDCERKPPDRCKICFSGDTIAYFGELENVVGQLAGAVQIHPVFQAYNFSHEECLAAELLILSGLTQDEFDLKISYNNIQELQTKSHIEFHTYSPVKGLIVLSDSGLWLFHESLVSEIERKKLTAGLHVIPASIDVEDEGILKDWLWVSSVKDLGRLFFERRFLYGLQRDNWKGEQFCTSSSHQWETLFVSQPVYRLLDNLSADEKGEIKFQPVELIG